MPSKHMFAVMENINGISWDSFSPQYKNSVFFKIDFETIGIKEAVFTKKMKNLQNYVTSTIPDAPEIFSEIPLPVYKKHSKTSECREIINQIKALTYTVTSESAQTNLQQHHLKEALNLLSKEPKTGHVLILNQRQKHKDLHKEVAQNKHKTKFENLPVPRKQKSNLTGRVGAENDPRKSTQNISVAPKKQILKKKFEDASKKVTRTALNFLLKALKISMNQLQELRVNSVTYIFKFFLIRNAKQYFQIKNTNDCL